MLAALRVPTISFQPQSVEWSAMGRYNSSSSNRMRMEGDQFFLRSPEEMYDCFPTLEDAVARSQQIADSVDIELDLGKRHFPAFPLPSGKNSTDYLRELCLE